MVSLGEAGRHRGRIGVPMSDLESARTRRLLSGGLVTLTGLAVTMEGTTFGMGTMARTGPGFFPTVLGVVLTFVGVLITVVPDRTEDHDTAAFGRPDWRGWSCIILGIAAFALIGEMAGLGPATFACVFISAFGDREATVKGSLILAVAATVVAAVVFSWLLKFQLPFVIWN